MLSSSKTNTERSLLTVKSTPILQRLAALNLSHSLGVQFLEIILSLLRYTFSNPPTLNLVPQIGKEGCFSKECSIDIFIIYYESQVRGSTALDPYLLMVIRCIMSFSSISYPVFYLNLIRMIERSTVLDNIDLRMN